VRAWLSTTSCCSHDDHQHDAAVTLWPQGSWLCKRLAAHTASAMPQVRAGNITSRPQLLCNKTAIIDQVRRHDSLCHQAGPSTEVLSTCQQQQAPVGSSLLYGVQCSHRELLAVAAAGRGPSWLLEAALLGPALPAASLQPQRSQLVPQRREHQRMRLCPGRPCLWHGQLDGTLQQGNFRIQKQKQPHPLNAGMPCHKVAPR
jgi:hypothetical protein